MGIHPVLKQQGDNVLMAATKSNSQPDRIYTLRGVYLRESTTWIRDTFDPLIPGQNLGPLMRTHPTRVECSEAKSLDASGTESIIRFCAFTNRLEFAYILHDSSHMPPSDEEIEKVIVAKITADITVDYLLNAENFPDQPALSKWGTSNVMVHAWPYWREFCHSTLCRMNLPVTMVPMLQINSAAKPPASETTSIVRTKVSKKLRSSKL